ncbi:EAL domain-containing protein [Polyangium aurulentum]|uniref:EAL domain-containing protein n=1 Tax=Polyangium aurulentum TaxID=2567896 RepID=UPI00146E3711|nr:EAL domain-containing protein [Polyangium aurulentum]UQA59440.1 EAL domain-containing protein [Polyangium aurulentum]
MGPVCHGMWLDELLASDHLSVAFQPIVDLRTADVVGREVLGRIGPGAQGAQARGVHGPAQLLELAHAHGRLVAVDRRFREIGIETLARKGGGGMFFLNVDPRVIDDPAFSAGFTRRLLDEHGVPPTRIVLELTESGELDSDKLERLVRHYASQGFRIALDDVGAGYASLNALVRVRPHFLKLDKALVRHLAGDPLRAHLVRSLADFGRRSGIQVIAEGIEEEKDLLALLACGVELGQGYLLARPAHEVAPLPDHVQDILLRAADTAPTSTRGSRLRQLSVASLRMDHEAVLPDACAHETAELLRHRPRNAALPVVCTQGKVHGLVGRDRLRSGGDEGSRVGRPVSEFMDADALRVDEHASIEIALRMAAARDEDRAYDPVIIERDGRYVGIVPVHVLLRAAADPSRPGVKIED